MRSQHCALHCSASRGKNCRRTGNSVNYSVIITTYVWAAEVYANSAADDGEIYANEGIELQPTFTSQVPQVRTDDVGELEEQEYQNMDEISRTASQRSASQDNDDDDKDDGGHQIYENVRRKPTPQPKPRRPY